MQEIIYYSGCFVCGDENIHGLKARFFYDGRRARTEVVASETFEGYPGILHGGVVSALLDEVMIKAILALDKYAVTAEITVSFKIPVKTGDRLTFAGWITKSKNRVLFCEGETGGVKCISLGYD